MDGDRLIYSMFLIKQPVIQIKYGDLFHKLFNVLPIIPQNGGTLIEKGWGNL